MAAPPQRGALLVRLALVDRKQWSAILTAKQQTNGERHMSFTPERQIKRGPYEVLVDRDADTQEVRVSVYRGEILLAIEFIQSLDVTIERLVGLASQRSPQFPRGTD